MLPKKNNENGGNQSVEVLGKQILLVFGNWGEFMIGKHALVGKHAR